MTTTQEMWKEIQEFVDDPLAIKYRDKLIDCLENDDPVRFSHILDLIAQESLGMNQEEMNELNKEIYGI